ncbi:uncharacterized protein LOC122249186 [Penaeus japonicus]|uniref:uncharacterized protein LOC122249186 n=1 Tax=Penaeus japonicus TaxID=27405 RepID=UPI001C715204|nr:uncharacterized protein LOC122249186 [Penaeus japonicus]
MKSTVATYYSGSGYSSKAVDGDVTTEYVSYYSDRPWWSVDLEAHYVVKAIRVLPNEYYSRFRYISVFVGVTKVLGLSDLDTHMLVGEYVGPYTASLGWLEFNVNETACGRYVSLKGTSDYLHVYEVEVLV